MNLASISMTGTGLAVFIIMTVASLFGLEVQEETTLAAVEGVVTFVAWVLVLWGQVRRKDLKWGLLRK